MKSLIRRWRISVLLLVVCTSGTLFAQTVLHCHTRDLTIELTREGAAAGTLAYFYELTNRGDQACTMRGYPTAIALNGQKQAVHEISFKQVRPTADDPKEFRVQTIRMEPGGHAWFRIEINTGARDRSCCPEASWLQIAPPQNQEPFQQLFPFVDGIPGGSIYFLEAGKAQ